MYAGNHRADADDEQRPLRRQMGIVPQEGFLFSGTIAENISFGRPDAMIDEVAAVGQHLTRWPGGA